MSTNPSCQYTRQKLLLDAVRKACMSAGSDARQNTVLASAFGISLFMRGTMPSMLSAML
jgi:hypothetical protein